MIVPRSAASSMPKSVCPGTQPSAHGPFPTAGALALAYDDVEAVVAQVERLSGALYAVADDGDRLVFEDFACLLQWKLFAGDDGFVYTAEIDLCHSRNCFL